VFGSEPHCNIVAAAAPCKAHDDLMGNEALTSNRHCHAIAEDDCDLFAAGQGDRLAAAYRGRARGFAFRQSAFRQKSVTKRAAAAEKW
jgi:hypothetical protein